MRFRQRCMMWQDVIIAFTFIALARSQQCPTPNWRVSHPEQPNDHPGHFGCEADTFVSGFSTKQMQDPKRIVINPRAPICRRTPCNDSSLPMVQCMTWNLMGQDIRVSCPSGHYLNSVSIPRGAKEGTLDTFGTACCAKLVSTSTRHDSCYLQEIETSASSGHVKCSSGFFVSGLQRSSCTGLQCLTKLKCCKPLADGNSDEPFIEKMMFQTAPDLALLAHYLGFQKCHGKGSPYVGEDLYFDGTVVKSGQGFSIHYGDMRIERGEMHYGELKEESSEIYKIFTGTETNKGSTPSKRTQRFEITMDRSVTHTTTKEFRTTREASFSVSYNPILIGLQSRAKYTFGYEDTTTKTDSEGRVQSDTFETVTSQTVPARSTMNFTMLVYRKVYSVEYTTDVCLKFSAEFQGSLKGGPGKNFHSKYQKPSGNVEISYRFGDKSEPFYEALKRMSSTLEEPWLWSEASNKHVRMKPLIDTLTTEGRYCMTLNGKFTDKHSHDVSVKWENAAGSTNRPEGNSLTDADSDTASHTETDADNDIYTTHIRLKTLDETALPNVNGASHLYFPSIMCYSIIMIALLL